MKNLLKSLKILSLFLIAFTFNSCSDDDDNSSNNDDTTTVVDVAVDNGFTSLASALQIANLVTTLEGDGPFTVFAPTNDAFQDLLNTNDTWNEISDIPVDLLTNVLLNHVIIGSEINSTALVNTGSGYATTGATGPDMANLSLYYNVVDGVVELNGGFDRTAGADVTTADVEADNGIVHVINKVLLPPTIVDFALANPALTNLVAAIGSADSQMDTDLAGALSGDGPFTVFAPTNDAFTSLLIELEETQLSDIAPATVEDILLIHVLSDNVRSSELTTTSVATLGGESIAIDATALTITDPNDRVSGIVTTLIDIQGSNGVVHVIDRVLLNLQNN